MKANQDGATTNLEMDLDAINMERGNCPCFVYKMERVLILKKLGRTLANENKNKISKPQKKRFHDKKNQRHFWEFANTVAAASGSSSEGLRKVVILQ